MFGSWKVPRREKMLNKLWEKMLRKLFSHVWSHHGKYGKKIKYN